MVCFKMKREDRDEKYFIKNGGVILEELIAFCNGRCNPIHHFSTNELLKATNNYDPSQIFLKDACYKLYQGSLKDCSIFVKKYEKSTFTGNHAAMPHKDITIGSQMSVHKNVLKVIGYCLDTQHPAIVYEFAGTKVLSQCISRLPWKCRLKISADLANAVAYLHTAFSRPVIYRDIKSKTILLDENNVPKLTDFGLCISIPKDESHVEDVVIGRLESPAPEYCLKGYLTEKADIYSFGVLLFELITGKRPIELIWMENSTFYNLSHCVEELSSLVDPSIKNEGIQLEQLLDFRTLIVRCISKDEELRPTMTDVGKELRRIYQTFS